MITCFWFYFYHKKVSELKAFLALYVTLFPSPCLLSLYRPFQTLYQDHR